MRFRYSGLLTLVLIMALAVSITAQNKKSGKKEMAITFDELPGSQSFGEVDYQAINYLVLQALKKHKVKATGFVVGSYIEDNFDLLGEWLNQGHQLGNLTFNQQDFNDVDFDSFIRDIVHGEDALEPMLEGFGQKKRFFRYPYLHYGTSVEGKREVQQFLEDHNITVAHATIVVEDYLYNLSLEKVGKTPDSAQYEQLMNDYINHVLDQIEGTERMAREVLGRPCRQILELRANRLNAIYLDEMLTQIEKIGYKFISLDRALNDKLYEAPEAYYDLKGVGYIEMLMRSNPDLLPAE